MKSSAVLNSRQERTAGSTSHFGSSKAVSGSSAILVGGSSSVTTATPLIRRRQSTALHAASQRIVPRQAPFRDFALLSTQSCKRTCGRDFHNRTSILTTRTTRLGGNLRRFSQIISRQEYLAKICTSDATAKPPALGDADGFALSPQTMPRLPKGGDGIVWGCRTVSWEQPPVVALTAAFSWRWNTDSVETVSGSAAFILHGTAYWYRRVDTCRRICRPRAEIAAAQSPLLSR